ncbi:HD domain-containing protein [Heliobacillus mobilis]|uniref:HD domain-containing protein n=1 Tax=Heliobacterium mobile TaxID=28064 RepID=A0A6I3SIG6_HELMO|nr:HD-GYP domain-containing protein [Heliobacterium mobile]MTV48630.1 HD domain-containing protein [Heliobacterium mobile]
MAETIPSKLFLPNLIEGFALAIDLAEGKPLQHAYTVTYIAMNIARALDISLKDRNVLYYGSLLHDISFSSHRGLCPLCHTMEERGVSCFVPVLLEADQAVHRSRELWDGSGPIGLQGDTIPLTARILTVAIAAEKAGGERRDFWSWRQQVQDCLLKQNEKLYDPQIIDALKGLFRERRFSLDLMSLHHDRMIEPFQPNDFVPSVSETIDIMGNAFALFIDQKTPYTANHSRDVAQVAREIAKAMGMDEATQHSIYLAGLLHDLGKIAIPNSILEKPGTLTIEEFNIIKNHPYYSDFILNRIPELERISLWAAAHHERLDGTGYFLGLQKEAIPLEARIIAVADVYAALAVDRPYRKKLEPKEIIEIIKDMAIKKHLDRNVSDTLFSILDHNPSLLSPSGIVGISESISST